MCSLEPSDYLRNAIVDGKLAVVSGSCANTLNGNLVLLLARSIAVSVIMLAVSGARAIALALQNAGRAAICGRRLIPIWREGS